MSAETKQEALAKADAMIRRLGYPDYLDEKVGEEEMSVLILFEEEEEKRCLC